MFTMNSAIKFRVHRIAYATRIKDYRNPIVAEAMRGLKYVNMFNRGIQRVKNLLQENGYPEPVFNVDKITAFEVVVSPSLSLNLVTDEEKVIKLL